MKLSEAIEKNRPLVVIHPIGGQRYCAETFIVPEGIVFLDIGWDTGSSHGIHMIKGAVPEGDEPWQVGDATIRILDEYDDVMGDAMLWWAYRQSTEGQNATREQARKYMCDTYDCPE